MKHTPRQLLAVAVACVLMCGCSHAGKAEPQTDMYIVFPDQLAAPGGAVYYITLDGEQETRLDLGTGVDDCWLYEGDLYYLTHDYESSGNEGGHMTHELVRYASGVTERLATGLGQTFYQRGNIQIEEDSLYYLQYDERDDLWLCAYDLKHGTHERLFQEPVTAFSVFEAWIYYTTDRDSAVIYRYDLKSGQHHAVTTPHEDAESVTLGSAHSFGVVYYKEVRVNNLTSKSVMISQNGETGKRVEVDVNIRIDFSIGEIGYYTEHDGVYTINLKTLKEDGRLIDTESIIGDYPQRVFHFDNWVYFSFDDYSPYYRYSLKTKAVEACPPSVRGRVVEMDAEGGRFS